LDRGDFPADRLRHRHQHQGWLVTDPNPSERLAEIEARMKAATEGGWFVVGPPWNEAAPFINAVSEDPHGGEVVCDFTYCGFDADVRETNNSEANAEFIAHARSDIPWLLEREKKLREAMKKEHGCVLGRVPMMEGHYESCPVCEALADSGEASGEATESAP
jgi:hypothetical protein